MDHRNLQQLLRMTGSFAWRSGPAERRNIPVSRQLLKQKVSANVCRCQCDVLMRHWAFLSEIITQLGGDAQLDLDRVLKPWRAASERQSTTVAIEGQLLRYFLKNWLIYVTADQNKH